MSMSSLTRSQLWEVSGRWENAGKELYRLTDRRDNQLCLAPTCEGIAFMLFGLLFVTVKSGRVHDSISLVRVKRFP